MIRKIPYRVTGKELIEKIEEFLTEFERIWDIWIKYLHSKGAKDGIACGWQFIGVIFDDPTIIPKGWYHPKRWDKNPKYKNLYKPRRRSPDYHEYLDLPIGPTDENFARLFGYDLHKNNPPGLNGGVLFANIGCIQRNGIYYVEIPDYLLIQHPIPDGLDELKVTEFQAILNEESDQV